MGPGQKHLTWVESGQPSMVWVRKISPINVKFFNILPYGSKSTWVKGGLASYLLRVKSKVGSGPISSPNPSLISNRLKLPWTACWSFSLATPLTKRNVWRVNSSRAVPKNHFLWLNLESTVEKMKFWFTRKQSWLNLEFLTMVKIIWKLLVKNFKNWSGWFFI